MVTIVVTQTKYLRQKSVFLSYLYKMEPTKRLKRKQRFIYFLFTLPIASIWQQWLCHMIKHPRVPLNWILSVLLELLPSRSRVNFELFFRSGAVGGLVVTENVYIWNSRTIWGKFLSADAAHVSRQTWRFDFHWEYSLLARSHDTPPHCAAAHSPWRTHQTCVVVGDVHLGHKGENEET